MKYTIIAIGFLMILFSSAVYADSNTANAEFGDRYNECLANYSKEFCDCTAATDKTDACTLADNQINSGSCLAEHKVCLDGIRTTLDLHQCDLQQIECLKGQLEERLSKLN